MGSRQDLSRILDHRLRRTAATAGVSTLILSTLLGGIQPVAAASSGATVDYGGRQTLVAAQQNDQSLGSYLGALVSAAESRGGLIGEIGTEWADPTDGTVTDLIYTGNKVVHSRKTRRFDAVGHATDTLLSTDVIATATPTKAVADANVHAGVAKFSTHPPKSYFDTLDNLDGQFQKKVQQAEQAPAALGPLEQLGLVGRANAASVGQEWFNNHATAYGGYENYGDLSFSWSTVWYNPSGQSGYHSAWVYTSGTWNGSYAPTGADPGTRDVMDGEYDPGLMYLYGYGWSPDLSSGWPCAGGFDISMSAGLGNGYNGAYVQQPSHCSKYNTLLLDIRPKSAASYNVWYNEYFNYTHTWNYSPYGLSFSAGYGFLSVSVPLGGQWNKQHISAEFI